MFVWDLRELCTPGALTRRTSARWGTGPTKFGSGYARSGCREDGDAAVLVSCFKSDETVIKLKIENYPILPGSGKVYLIDSEHDLELLKGVSFSSQEISLAKPKGSAVFLVQMQQLGKK